MFFLLCGCSQNSVSIDTEVLNDSCIKPMYQYHYMLCKYLRFRVDKKTYHVPQYFITDLASIPRFVWPILAPSNSSLMRAAIVHDWFYRGSCYFNRAQADLIFYHMLINDGVSKFRAGIMYHAVRLFGWRFYESYDCKKMDEDDGWEDHGR